MHLRAIVRRWHEHLEAVAGQSVAVKVLLHGKGGTQQPNRAQPGLGDRLRGGVDEVQQWDIDRGLNLIGDLMHRVMQINNSSAPPASNCLAASNSQDLWIKIF